jgi:hypothetical protein
VTHISIDRLSVTLSGSSAGDGERLARLIAEKLAAASPGLQASGQRESVKVELPRAKGSNLDQLAEQVVADLVRQLGRTL